MVVSTESISSCSPRSAWCLAALAFEGERLGDHRDGERAHLAGQRSDDRRRAGAGSAAEAGGDEHHVGAFQRLDDLVGVFQRGLAADFGIGARAQAVGQLDAELDLHRRARHLAAPAGRCWRPRTRRPPDATSIMRLTALPPPPPTPMTLIFALLSGLR